MPSVILVPLLAVVAGYLAGGRLTAIPRVGVRLSWLAAIGLGLQVLPIRGLDTETALTLLWVSFGALTLFAVINIRLSGFLLILLGVLLNLVVITVNDGMPINEHALVAAGQEGQIAQLEAGSFGVKYRLAQPGDQLLPLSDVIVLRPPISEVVSVGDLIVDAGLAWFLFAAMGPKRRRRETKAPEREHLAQSRDP
jgi:hypothetical protein